MPMSFGGLRYFSGSFLQLKSIIVAITNQTAKAALTFSSAPNPLPFGNLFPAPGTDIL